MKQLLSLCVVSLLLASSSAHAGGLSMRWDACEGDGGTQNLMFACNTNVGSRALVCSVTLDSDMLDVVSDDTSIEIYAAGSQLPPWWELRSNVSQSFIACRNSSLSITAQNGASCPDIFALTASMNIAAFFPFASSGGARFTSVNAVPNQDARDLILANHPTGNATWGIARFLISNFRTVGTPSCSNCTTPVCLWFRSCSVSVVGHLGDRNFVANASTPGSDFVTWQSSGPSSCPGFVPTRNATWGAVKTLYR